MIQNPENKIAIVGMAARLPGARDIDAFWDNLINGRSALEWFSDEDIQNSLKQIDYAALPLTLHEIADPNFVRAGFSMKDPDLFDADFFGYTPGEAELIDPQQRQFLEVSWSALEHAGYVPDDYPGLIGVYGGQSLSRYFLTNIWSNREIMYSPRDLLAGIGSEADYLPNRVSYKLNLRGPAVNVQTACSTSLVAIHMGCQSLLNGESDMVLAGGSVVQFPDRLGYLYREGSMMSPNGQVRSFDADAKGTVFTNSGVGVIVLKRLEDAIADGDTVYGIICGSAVNNDGSHKVGYTAPAIQGQTEVLEQALAVADVPGHTISYIEAHGTGTPLGDPIEVTALAQVYGAGTDKRQYCALGSVKSNIGHLAAAAGVAATIKATLALHHKQIPASLNFEKPNPRIDFENSPFFVNTSLRPWETEDGLPRRCAVSSFGVGGTNAHLVLEEMPEREESIACARPWQLLLISARSENALAKATENLLQHLEKHPEAHLEDVAHTLQTGRKSFKNRRMLVVRDHADALKVLRGEEPARLLSAVREGDKTPELAFMFSGQGSQYVNMGRGLYESEASFREAVDTCATHLRPLLGLDLRDVLYPSAGREEEARELLTQTRITQPALFTVEYAMSRLMQAHGIEAQTAIGHSVGEYVAAHLAGVMSLEDALRLVAARARMMQELPAGAMMSVPLPEDQLLPLIGDNLSLAAINAPGSCVVSGPFEAIDALEQRLQQQDIGCRRLHTSHAFHSLMMEPILEDFRALLQQTRLNPPKRPYVSNVTGKWIKPEEATSAEYWVRHLRGTVRFAQGLATLVNDRPNTILLELGPGNTLSTLARRGAGNKSAIVNTLRHATEETEDRVTLLGALGRLWLGGISADWSSLYDTPRRRIALPTYPFEGKRFWVEPLHDSEHASMTLPVGKQKDVADWFYIPSWDRLMAPRLQAPQEDLGPWLLFQAGPIGATVANRLRAWNQRVISVSPGEAFSGSVEEGFTIHPERAEDYDQLWSQLGENKPSRIIHTWPVDSLRLVSPSDIYRQSQSRGFYSLVFLAQTLGRAGGAENLSITIATPNTQEVIGGEGSSVEWSTVLGPVKVLPIEYPGLSVRCVDLDLHDGLVETLADQVLAETLSGAQDELSAYRGAYRWVRGWTKQALPTVDGQPLHLKEHGVYLITGGLGGLGLVMAEELARQAHARLILTGRSALPPRETWADRLASGDAAADRIRKVQALEALGAEVLVLGADVTDEASMQAAIDEARRHFGPIDGVIHSAGVAGGGMVQLKTVEAADKVLAPKVLGALILDKVLGEQRPELFILNSSLFAVTGGMGQVDYTGANSFLDAFAYSMSSRDGCFAVSVNWDGWEEVGMAAGLFKTDRRTEGQPADLQHPFILRRLPDEDEARVYQSVFNEDFWILNEHRINGQPAVPGTAWLEMARAVGQHVLGGEPVELSNVFFMSPMMFESGGNRAARLTVRPAGAGSVEVTAQGEAGEQWTPHASVVVTTVKPAERPHYDLDELVRRCAARTMEFGPDDKAGEGHFLTLGEHWQTLKTMYLGDKEGLAWFELPEALAADLAQLPLHPALLDMATGPSTGHVIATGLDADHADALYLPLSYDKLHVFAPLERKLYAYSRFHPERDATFETVSLDIAILDERGDTLVVVEGFTLKKVRGNLAAPTSHATQGKPMEADGNGGILPNEGADALRRILTHLSMPQVVVSTSDLAALLKRLRDSSGPSGPGKQGEQKAGGEKHERPNLQTAYSEPRNDLEATLAAIFEGVLGIAPVGIHDNFFELGMDSVLGIQVVSQARKYGLTLAPNQLFEQQTIADLSAGMGDQTVNLGATLGTSVAQDDYLDAQGVSHHAWLRPALGGMDGERLDEAAKLLVKRHDALRMHFSGDADSRKVSFDGAAPTLVTRDLASAEDAQSVIAELAAELKPDQGALLRLAHLRTRQDSDLILAVAHPALLDSESGAWLLEDWYGIYNLLGQGARPEEIAGRNFADWLKKLAEHQPERDYWMNVSEGKGVLEGAAVKMVGHLKEELVSGLIEHALPAFNLRTDELLAIALTIALHRHGKPTLLALNGQGRKAFGDEGWTHTMGCFDALYALRIHADFDAELDEQILALKEALRRVPAQGIGYGKLRQDSELSAELTHRLRVATGLRYQESGDGVSVDPFGHGLQLNVHREGAAMRLHWHYLDGVWMPDELTDMSATFIQVLRDIVTLSQSSQNPAFTPSDFGDADLSMEDLSNILEGFGSN
ncbi:MAG: SDR family NAD(P)-dependent oxidoreductase [Pseudomonadota bacterium]